MKKRLILGLLVASCIGLIGCGKKEEVVLPSDNGFLEGIKPSVDFEEETKRLSLKTEEKYKIYFEKYEKVKEEVIAQLEEEQREVIEKVEKANDRVSRLTSIDSNISFEESCKDVPQDVSDHFNSYCDYYTNLMDSIDLEGLDYTPFTELPKYTSDDIDKFHEENTMYEHTTEYFLSELGYWLIQDPEAGDMPSFTPDGNHSVETGMDYSQTYFHLFEDESVLGTKGLLMKYKVEGSPRYILFLSDSGYDKPRAWGMPTIGIALDNFTEKEETLMNLVVRGGGVVHKNGYVFFLETLCVYGLENPVEKFMQ